MSSVKLMKCVIVGGTALLAVGLGSVGTPAQALELQKGGYNSDKTYTFVEEKKLEKLQMKAKELADLKTRYTELKEWKTQGLKIYNKLKEQVQLKDLQHKKQQATLKANLEKQGRKEYTQLKASVQAWMGGYGRWESYSQKEDKKCGLFKEIFEIADKKLKSYSGLGEVPATLEAEIETARYAMKRCEGEEAVWDKDWRKIRREMGLKVEVEAEDPESTMIPSSVIYIN